MNILRSYIFWSIIRLVRVITLKAFFDVNLICILFIKDDDFRNTMKKKKYLNSRCMRQHSKIFKETSPENGKSAISLVQVCLVYNPATVLLLNLLLLSHYLLQYFNMITLGYFMYSLYIHQFLL